jgi:hypothetical protein
VTRRPDKDIGEERDMPNKLKVLVVGKKVGRSSAYEIAGTVSSEMGCKCQADVEKLKPTPIEEDEE